MLVLPTSNTDSSRLGERCVTGMLPTTAWRALNWSPNAGLGAVPTVACDASMVAVCRTEAQQCQVIYADVGLVVAQRSDQICNRSDLCTPMSTPRDVRCSSIKLKRHL